MRYYILYQSGKLTYYENLVKQLGTITLDSATEIKANEEEDCSGASFILKTKKVEHVFYEPDSDVSKEYEGHCNDVK